MSREQAQLAVRAGAGNVDTAFAIGRAVRGQSDPATAPAVTYFGFASAALTPVALVEVAALARYLHLHPEVQLTIVGHADPTGSDAYNEDLGLRRAQAVATQLTSAGVATSQLAVRSDGERSRVSTTAAQYRLDRRAAYSFASRPGPYRDAARDEAAAAVRAQVGPPFDSVTQYVPRPLPAPLASPGGQNQTSAGTQVELEDWHWGNIPANLHAEIDTWIRSKAAPVASGLATNAALDDAAIEGYTIRPRPIVEALLAELNANPAEFLGRAFGRPMSR